MKTKTQKNKQSVLLEQQKQTAACEVLPSIQRDFLCELSEEKGLLTTNQHVTLRKLLHINNRPVFNDFSLESHFLPYGTFLHWHVKHWVHLTLSFLAWAHGDERAHETAAQTVKSGTVHTDANVSLSEAEVVIETWQNGWKKGSAGGHVTRNKQCTDGWLSSYRSEEGSQVWQERMKSAKRVKKDRVCSCSSEKCHRMSSGGLESSCWVRVRGFGLFSRL